MEEYSHYQAMSMDAAVKTIERCWCSYRNRQIFKLLKYAICAAEHSMTKEVIRKISPNEAELLNDPTCHARIRCRFGGTEFPPLILFKVYIKCGENGIQYYSGKKMIRASSKAAEDSCKLMGNRQFYDQMIIDACQQHQDKINNEFDINTMKDVMQYLSNLDECPPEKGGKSNLWRQLSLTDFPRHNIVHDVMTYVQSGKISGIMNLEQSLSTKPLQQRDQLKTFLSIGNDSTRRIQSSRLPESREKLSGRRTRWAKKRVEKMKKNYGFSEGRAYPQESESQNGKKENIDMTNVQEESDWEESEADELYEWSQDLTLDKLGVNTPMF